MKNLLIIILTLLTVSAFAQYDTIIKNEVYTSYFSKRLKEPVYVTYKLYKAGGKGSRAGLVFKVDGVKGTATPKDYRGSGYDEGHLADAADFSNNPKREELTFRFYNCVPQDPHLNRGIWKHYETEIRKLSQNDSLLVITGSVFGHKTIGFNGVALPNLCWKVVESLTTKKILYCFTITNDEDSKEVDFTVVELQKLLGYAIPLK